MTKCKTLNTEHYVVCYDNNNGNVNFQPHYYNLSFYIYYEPALMAKTQLYIRSN